jgi:hypothetical protein
MASKKVVKGQTVCCSSNGCGGAIYGLGFVGSAIYYISISTGFWMGVLGVLKAVVWPAFLIYDAMKFLGM